MEMMTRFTALLLAAAAFSPADAADPPAQKAAVSHAHHAHRARHAHKAAVPPAAPAAAAKLPPAIAGTEPAPVPNEAVSDVPPGQAPATHVTPSLLQLHYPNVGDGYVQGSSPQAMDDRNTAKAPGVEVEVPLKQ
jgi:hypothetical protein